MIAIWSSRLLLCSASTFWPSVASLPRIRASSASRGALVAAWLSNGSCERHARVNAMRVEAAARLRLMREEWGEGVGPHQLITLAFEVLTPGR